MRNCQLNVHNIKFKLYYLYINCNYLIINIFMNLFIWSLNFLNKFINNSSYSKSSYFRFTIEFSILDYNKI